MIFTTSWDDGYALDLKVADLLEKYNFTGTFYICPKSQHNQSMLSMNDVRKLSQRHEIGSHTINHPKLTKITPEEAWRELMLSKKLIEDWTGKPCRMFCYPKGDVNRVVCDLVKEAGYEGARTISETYFEGSDPYLMPVSWQVTSFPFRRSRGLIWKLADPIGPLRVRRHALKKYRVPLSAYGNWLKSAQALFHYALAHDCSSYHLWGHSAEIEKFNMWSQLEQFLVYVKEKNISSGTNHDLLSTILPAPTGDTPPSCDQN